MPLLLCSAPLCEEARRRELEAASTALRDQVRRGPGSQVSLCRWFSFAQVAMHKEAAQAQII